MFEEKKVYLGRDLAHQGGPSGSGSEKAKHPLVHVVFGKIVKKEPPHPIFEAYVSSNLWTANGNVDKGLGFRNIPALCLGEIPIFSADPCVKFPPNLGL